MAIPSNADPKRSQVTQVQPKQRRGCAAMRFPYEHIKLLQRRVDFLKSREHQNSYDLAEIGSLEWALANLSAEAEKQEPHSWYSAQEDEWMTNKIRKEHERLNSYTHKVGKFDLALYTHPQPKQPLTDEQMFDLAEIAWRHGWASCRDAEYIGEEAEDERWGMIGAEVVQNMAAHGIKE